MAAVTALLEYLSVNSVAPLQREMVEIRDPLCSEVRNEEISSINKILGAKVSDLLDVN